MAIFKALLFLGVVSSNVFAIEAPIPGYDIETLGRNVHLDPRDGGDSPITLSDTIEQGTSKVKKVNPRWARDLEMRKPLPDNEPRCTATREWPCKVDCIDDLQGEPWYRADLLFVREGFDYLMKHSGKPKLGPGPDKCERVSCSYKSSIWWCNKSHAYVAEIPRRNSNLGVLALDEFNDLTDRKAVYRTYRDKEGPRLLRSQSIR
ncbi:uncharacterized protein CPUR_07691 [Claviceps purpurea 20.1]|uniref:Uncharacterized protein n=1 Tax=Claviceps purpurea (strain 20.1) TaxID=1111077 RepID=M1WBR0_CLAP2|nr:uncharacterized protein CPUR_07691 [Claviceps purpurea 20.1]